MKTISDALVVLVALVALLTYAAVAATPAAGMENQPAPPEDTLVIRSTPVPLVCHQMRPCEILVRAEEAGGAPVEGARVLGLYTDSDGDTMTVRRVTDEAGQVTFLRFANEIVLEVQFPVGLFPCPDSPPRVRVSAEDTTINFRGCRL